ncbi:MULTISPECIES: NAD-dependent epimerase/dehydratase family protein [unclassified Bradyrhizobium]|uniref:NAD-dependent epimerase/dehydratase family protein n=1 Tax=unclassified Bradyrhizobium TaxID=2631580 RepID=UPI001CD341AC|nr:MULTISPECIES: NAD-dependent epimerase/dehydratase family protein [unclassified Bradyrhizobium]MCA1379003.1 NAD-dependent epimerase/dehydratase family protein [Bradyrhizobium sp. IC4060]MCA1488772.1 NAD-dependent epimerase/dehydratase family protein [Bradyrhizobium sp. IC4061]
MVNIALVTGGSGYFGEVLCKQLLARGIHVRMFDLNFPGFSHPNLEFFRGTILDRDAVKQAVSGVTKVFHNAAQNPLAKDLDLFWSVNKDGTQIIAEESAAAGVEKLIYTSSTAVYGTPKLNPITENTKPNPAEDYGRAKLAGENACKNAAKYYGLDIAIVRPRTILGHGRLGTAHILFDWIQRGLDIPVLAGGNNRYQFVHADDLAWACIAASGVKGFTEYNIGAAEFGTMRELLQALIDHAGTQSRIKSIPMWPTIPIANLASKLGLSPLGPFHLLAYGRSTYFDISKAQKELGYAPRYSNSEMIIDTYNWYQANKLCLSEVGASHHKSPVRKQILALIPHALRIIPG